MHGHAFEYVRMYVRMCAVCVCMYVCSAVLLYVCMYVCTHLLTHVCMYVCMHACLHECMRARMYMSVYACIPLTCVCACARMHDPGLQCPIPHNMWYGLAPATGSRDSRTMTSTSAPRPTVVVWVMGCAPVRDAP